MKRKWLALLIALSLAGCSNAPAQPQSTDNTDATADSQDQSSQDAEFEAFCEKDFIESCQQDWTMAHRYFQHPEKAGIDLSKVDYTLGYFVPTDEDIQEVKDWKEQLDQFDRNSLNPTNQDIYDQLQWDMNLTLESMKPEYTYLAPIWGSSSGVNLVLVDYFSEYMLYNEEGIAPFLKLIEDVPNYVNLAIEYSKKQAEQNCLVLDYENLKQQCQLVLDSQEDSPIKSELDDEVDQLMLDDETSASYKKQIHEALDTYFFPAFQTMIDEMEPLAKEADNEGIASFENGKEYYALLLQENTGTTDSLQEVYTNVLERMEELSKEHEQLLRTNPAAVLGADGLKTPFTSVSEIMPFLEEHYTQDFPPLTDIEYEIKPLSAEQSRAGVVAYYLVPTIDSTGPGQIRYNKVDYGDDPSDISLYNTLAHEGIPGHMYQFDYFKTIYTQNIQYAQSDMAMQEGYASFVANQALDWLDLDADALRAWKITEEYSNLMTLMMDLQINGMGMSLKEFTQTYGPGLEAAYMQLIGMPAEFAAYYYGTLKIQQMYDQSQETLGDSFEDAGFYKALLQAGNVNFDIVQENVDAWTSEVQNKQSA